LLLRRFSAHARSLTFAAAALTGAAAVALALALPAEGVAVSNASFWWIAAGSLVVTGLVVLRAGLWTATGAYAAVYWCFHFGLIAVLASGLVQPVEISAWDQAWVLGPFAADAAVLALVGSLAFASGANLLHAWRGSAASPRIMPDPADAAHPHGAAGSLAVIATAAIWCGIVVTASGTAGFSSSYAEYLQATSEFNAAMSVVWLGLGLGIVMSATGKPGWLRTGAIGVFCCLALVALPIGLRGEILFPSIAALVAAARCGRVLSPGRACAFVLGLLVLIPAVRDVRNTGLQGLPNMVLELRFFDAFMEMGGSLHPVEKVVRWKTEGEPFEMGRSYWAPIERAAARILPGLRSMAAEDDMRIMNVLVTDRVGAIGFSPVAEAYRNCGPLGVVVVLGLLGAAMAGMDRIRDRRIAVLVLATLYVPLLTNVRNSFVSVPTQCLAGLLFVAALAVVRHVSSSVLCRPYARAAYVRSQI
jgi:hypothetical protein